MPQWLQRQLKRAFLVRDSHQVRILNDCWYIYCQKHLSSYNERAHPSKSNH